MIAGDVLYCKKEFKINDIIIDDGEWCKIGYIGKLYFGTPSLTLVSEINRTDEKGQTSCLRLGSKLSSNVWFKLEKDKNVNAWGYNFSYLWDYFITEEEYKNINRTKLIDKILYGEIY